MKLTLNWLKQYVDFNWPPDELADRLTMIGIEVEGAQKLGGEFDGIVVAQILASGKHPNADKLSVCRVAEGRGERQIVCGATNYRVGDKVPLILPGQSLPATAGQPTVTIKAGRIRGVESQGMLCSPKELGLEEEADGLLILPADAQVGQSFAEHLGRPGGDVVFDLVITPNRPDLNNVIGIAREISAVTGNPLRLPTGDWGRTHSPASLNATEENSRDAAERVLASQDLVAVRIEDPEFCPRYSARVIRGVKVGNSPAWLQQALERVGIRSINNIVDATNYVMMETGQPLHAFDYHLIAKPRVAGVPSAEVGQDAKPTIFIRRAADGERFTTLDGQERTLTHQMLLIADETKAIALAGVMGGLNTEINDRTIDVLLESAYFKPQNIRATSKQLDLRTDAAYRFERGGDIGICDWASQRAARLIVETAGGQLASGVVDAYSQPAPPRQITLRHAKANELLGVDIPVEQQIQFLTRLGLEVVSDRASTCSPQAAILCIPTFRVDLKREADLIEEIARLFGVDNIPVTAPRGVFGAHAYDAVHDQLAEGRRILTGLGLNEAQGQTLISDDTISLLGLSRASVSSSLNPPLATIQLANPLSSEMNALRPSLLPGLLDSLRHNLHHQNADAALFEVGRVFRQTDGRLQEERRIAVALTGQRQPAFWTGDDRDATWSVYDLKGLLEVFLEHFGLRGVTWLRRQESHALYLESATLQLGRHSLGEWGQLLPALAKQYDLRGAVLLAELNLDVLLALRNTARSYRPLPAFPSIRRDVAMFVPEPTTHDAVVAVVKQAKPANLEAAEVFDVYRGNNIPAGQKSVAYAFTYRHAERTLTDAEVHAAHEKVVTQLKQKLPAVVREG